MNEFKFLKPTKMIHPNNGMTLEFLNKQDAIAALIISNDGKKGYFVSQFRPGTNNISTEVVAGLIDPGEIPKDALYREVEEESGFYKEDYEIIFQDNKPLAISPGYTTEKLNLYILKIKDNNIKQKPLNLDEDEELVGEWLDLNLALSKSSDFKTYYLIRIYELLRLKNDEA
ncbi:MAG: NUDIX hydrolase [Fusobacterium sp. JB021]|nr:NUDIX hydrolase [Fusobacterium sp. JB020]MDP0493118.1 NUDIX hydrolase [Fusobacterium sp. JB021]MDP0507460.1 NUDIX hydrolase [Fusobacterium sp. JB019]